MKRVVLFMFIGLMALYGCKKAPPAEVKPKWTIMVYADGNNNLDISQNNTSYVIEDIQEMEEVGSTDEVKIIAAVSSIKRGGLLKYYYIEKYTDELPDSLSSPVLQTLGTKDMSDPQTLKDFINYVKENYPANHYMLVIDDHGAGWRGVCQDEQNGAGDLMSIPELREVLEDVDIHFDIIVFHACLMAMVEVAYELKDVADYMCGSQFMMPMESVLGSAEWLGALVANPEMSASELGQKIVTAVYNAGERKGKDVHFALIDLSKMNTLAAKIGDFGNHLVTEVETATEWQEVLHAFNETHYTQYDDPAFVDLREYAKRVKQQPTIGQKPLIRQDADAIIDAINDAVPFTMTNVAGLTRGGVNIHFPFNHELFDSTNYVRLRFRATNWHAFLSKFIASIGGGPVTGVTISGTVTWPGHTLSNRCYAFMDTSHTEYIVIAAITQVDPQTGNYTITWEIDEPKEIFVEAWDDVDGNGEFSVGDGFGWWDKDNNGQWDWDDMFTVNPGDVITGADIELFEITSVKENKLVLNTPYGVITVPKALNK